MLAWSSRSRTQIVTTDELALAPGHGITSIQRLGNPRTN